MEIRGNGTAHVCANDLKALIDGADFSPVKRIDENFARCMIECGNKMSRQSDPAHIQAQTPANFDIDKGKRNGNALLSVKYPVKETVVRIVIIFSIPTKPLLFEKNVIQPRDDIRQVLNRPSCQVLRWRPCGPNVPGIKTHSDRDMPPWQLKERHGLNRSVHPQEMLIVKIPYLLYRLNPMLEAFLI